MGLKSEFKPVCKKIWKAFNSWRKRGMWFRLTILLIIGFSALFERMLTTDHVPLINEFVWIACRAIRYGSEPKVISAHLRYLHIQKSRQLQKQLREKVKDNSLHLNPNEMKLLNQSTVDANYNKLFDLAKRANLIPANFTLSQSKRAMLDKACKLTDERFGSEWEDVRQETRKEYHFRTDVLLMKLKMLGYGILMIFPLPLIPVLPWLILCFTLGVWGASLKSQAKFFLFSTLAVVMTFVWLYFSAYLGKDWEGWRANYLWSLLGISVFLAIWALVGSILGRRLYKYASKYSKETQFLIFSLLISGIIFLIPNTLFVRHYRLWGFRLTWTGSYLLFKSSAFAPYFVTIGIGVLLYTLFFVHKTYAQKLEKFKWLMTIKYLLIIIFALKLVFTWHPILSKYFKF